MSEDTTILGNYYDKYKSANPVERFLLKNYEDTFKKIVASLSVKTVYEVGSGEGVLLKWIGDLGLDVRLYGSDISSIFDYSLFVDSPAKPMLLINDAENIPVGSKTVDLVLACEVLEHLVNPAKCLQEFQRLKAGYYLLTVPNDRLWRMLNILRLKYVKYLGNTPGHRNHWNRRSFCELVSAYLNIQYSLYVHPWIFVLATSKTED